MATWKVVILRVMVGIWEMQMASNMYTVMIHGITSNSFMTQNYKSLLECHNKKLYGINSPQ
jgi:hypothetical protein